jgi:hypothetical protein
MDEREWMLIPGTLVCIREKYRGSGLPKDIGVLGRIATLEDRQRLALPSEKMFLVLFSEHLDFFPEYYLDIVRPSNKLHPEGFRTTLRMLFEEPRELNSFHWEKW